MLDTKFLEEYPLYRKFKAQIPSLNKLRWPAINLYCPVCGNNRTFTPKDNFNNTRYPVKDVWVGDCLAGVTGLIVYVCSDCNKHYQAYSLRFSEDLTFVMKVGQYPAWSVSLDKGLANILRDHGENYRKGLICEAQGYGIGAYAYYRRIVEGIIDTLLSSIHDLLNGQDKKSYGQALEQASKSVIAKDKIALVKDLLPQSLRPDNMNPLSILHDTLSEGIHALSDDECLEIAAHIREIIVYLVEKINEHSRSKETKQGFTNGMRRLLEKKKIK
jgi:hypothetical protein